MITRTSALSFRDQVRRHHIHLRTGSYSGHEPPDVVAATLTIEAVERHQNSLDNPGFCTLCGAAADGVEPDACKYECESCGEPGVYGADELLLEMSVGPASVAG